MPKKAKKNNQKIPDDAEIDEVKEQPKSKKKEVKGAFDLKGIFSESFRGRLSEYISLNQQVLDTKAKVQGNDLSDQIEERKQNMAQRVEKTAADILRLELGSLEDWIGDQQVQLSADIVKIGTVLQETKATLLGTGAFSEAQIAKQLEPIQARSDQKQKAYDSFGDLIRRSKEIYS